MAHETVPMVPPAERRPPAPADDSAPRLAAALASAQAEIRGAARDATNPHLRNRYADLASVWDACREPLTRHGLAVVQLPGPMPDGQFGLRTVLMHASGEERESWIPLIFGEEKGLKPMQAMGSAITYARRYGLAAIAGVCPDDDDAEGSGSKARKSAWKDAPPPAQAYDSEPPPRQSALPPGGNPSGDRAYQVWARDFVERVNLRWHDLHPEEGVKELLRVEQLTGHLYVAKAGGARSDGVIANHRLRAVAVAYAADPGAFQEEARRYVAGIVDKMESPPEPGADDEGDREDPDEAARREYGPGAEG